MANQVGKRYQCTVCGSEFLVTKGGGKTTACAICHGEGLKGLGPAPARITSAWS